MIIANPDALTPDQLARVRADLGGHPVIIDMMADEKLTQEEAIDMTLDCVRLGFLTMGIEDDGAVKFVEPSKAGHLMNDLDDIRPGFAELIVADAMIRAGEPTKH